MSNSPQQTHQSKTRVLEFFSKDTPRRLSAKRFVCAVNKTTWKIFRTCLSQRIVADTSTWFYRIHANLLRSRARSLLALRRSSWFRLQKKTPTLTVAPLTTRMRDARKRAAAVRGLKHSHDRPFLFTPFFYCIIPFFHRARGEQTALKL